MKLTRISHSSPEWLLLFSMGAGDFLGEKDSTEFWAVCAPEPIGVLGFEQLSPDACECELWVREDLRGRWCTRSFYPMLLGIGFSKANTIIAAVERGSASHGMVKRWGWKMYCQQDGLSYYQIHKESLHA